jgi:translocation and assembly module TamB
MVKRVTTKVIEEVETEDGEAASLPAGRRRSWMGWLVGRVGLLAAVLGTLAWFAPTIIATTGLWKPLVSRFVPPLAGRVDAGSLSLGWLSPIVMRDLVVRDEAGEILAQVSAFQSEKSLLSLAQNPSDLGKFTVDEPLGRIVLRGDGSNLEDLLARFAKEFPPREAKSPTAMPAFALALTRGTIQLEDQVAGQRWELADMQLDVDFSQAREPRTGKLSASLKHMPSAAGKAALGNSPRVEIPSGEIAADLNWQPAPPADGKPEGLGAGKVTCEFKSLPVEIAQGAIRRLAGDIRPAGALTGSLVYEWKDDAAAQRLEISKLSSPLLTVAAPAFLGTDRPSIRLASASGGIEIADKRLLLDQLRIQSDVVALSANLAGKAPTLDLAGILSAVQSTKKDDGLEVSGEIDLAALAQRLPQTLRLRQDTRITEGLFDFSLKSGFSQQGERSWEGTANTTRIVAETAGRKVAWDQPLEFAATVRHARSGIVIDRLRGTASFATLQGEGTLEAGKLTADADLDKLVAELGRFVDWTGIALAGKLHSEVQWERGPASPFTATADASVQDFQLAAPGVSPWKEQNLQLHAQATGQADTTSIQQITQADFHILSGSDKFLARLQKPITDLSLTGSWPIAYTLEGDLATWLPRLQSFVPLADWRISGGINAEGSGEFSTSRVAIGPTKVTLLQLVAASRQFYIREPKVVLETAGALDVEKQTFTSQATTFASSAVAFRADDLKAAFGSAGTSLAGHLEYRAKLDVLSSWLGAPQYPRTWQFGGDVVGGADAAMENGIMQANFTTEIENLSYSSRKPLGGTPTALRGREAGIEATPAALSPWQLAWSEPKVTLSGDGSFDPQKDRLELRSTRLDSAALALAVAGSVEQVSSRCLTALGGEINYDLAGITQKLRPLLGESLKITGKEQRKFSLQGPLFAGAAKSTDPAAIPDISTLGKVPKVSLVPDDLTAAAGIGWESAEYFGLAAGPTSVETRLEKGLVSIGPLDVPISAGKLTAAPRIYLNEAGIPVVLDKGPLLENVRLSPELCRGWLRYVQPTIADATRAEGNFSVAIEQAQVPLLAPRSAAVKSTLTIHGGQVGPGPLAQQYLGALQQVLTVLKPAGGGGLLDSNKGWIIFPEQQVPVVVQDQRVHHQGMTMQIGNVQVFTHGSVGLDDSLQMVLSIPVQNAWLRDSKAGALQGKTIHIPIRGTVSSPQPDMGGVLSDLTKQILGGSVKDLFKGELNKGKGLLDKEAGKLLDGLFKPKLKP